MGTKKVYSTHLLVQHMGARHWMQLTGLDELLAHETQLTGSWSLRTEEGWLKSEEPLGLLPLMPVIPSSSSM